VGIITALSHEFGAACHLLGCSPDPVAGDSRSAALYAMTRVSSRTGGSHTVAVTQLPGIGNNSAAIRTTTLLNDCPKVNHVLMVGIAGAVPAPAKAEDHVRLGDLVVSNGVVQYDFGKLATTGYQPRPPPRPASQALLQAVQFLRSQEDQGRRPWDSLIDSAILSLGDKYARLPDTSDILKDNPTAAASAGHPSDPARKAGYPRVFQGIIGSGNIVLKDPRIRDQLRDRFEVKAVEMEASGTADATWHDAAGYLVIRGTCDYCNGDKNNDWQRYAAVIAAAYARCVIELIPVPAEVRTLTEAGPSALRKDIRELRETLNKIRSTFDDVGAITGSATGALPTRAAEVRLQENRRTECYAFDQAEAMARTIGLPERIRRAIRVGDRRIAAALGQELEELLASLHQALLPAAKMRECWLVLYDLEAVKLIGQTPAPAHSVQRMRDFLEKAKNVPGT
jgi:nucleoside phosphorylase